MDIGCARLVCPAVLLIGQGEQDLGLDLIGGRVDSAASAVRAVLLCLCEGGSYGGRVGASAGGVDAVAALELLADPLLGTDCFRLLMRQARAT